MNEKLIAKKKERITKIDESIQRLTKLSKESIEDANFFSALSIGLEGLTPAFLPAGIPAVAMIENFESLKDFDEDVSTPRKIATIAGCCAISVPLAATSLLLAAAPAMVIMPPLALSSAISSAHISAKNKRIKKAPQRIAKLEKEKEVLLKEIKSLETDNEKSK